MTLVLHDPSTAGHDIAHGALTGHEYVGIERLSRVPTGQRNMIRVDHGKVSTRAGNNRAGTEIERLRTACCGKRPQSRGRVRLARRGRNVAAARTR